MEQTTFDMEKYGLPDHMIAIDMNNFQGKSALDVMNQEDEESAKLFAQLPSVVQGVGPSLPPELMSKTIQQLKALGAEDVGSFDWDPRTRAMTENKSIDIIDDEESSERTRKVMHAMENDEDFYVDSLLANDDPFDEDYSIP